MKIVIRNYKDRNNVINNNYSFTAFISYHNNVELALTPDLKVYFWLNNYFNSSTL